MIGEKAALHERWKFGKEFFIGIWGGGGFEPQNRNLLQELETAAKAEKEPQNRIFGNQDMAFLYLFVFT